MAFKLNWHDDSLIHVRHIYIYNRHAGFDDIDLHTRSQWLDRGGEISVELSRQLSNLALNLPQR